MASAHIVFVISNILNCLCCCMYVLCTGVSMCVLVCMYTCRWRSEVSLGWYPGRRVQDTTLLLETEFPSGS